MAPTKYQPGGPQPLIAAKNISADVNINGKFSLSKPGSLSRSPITSIRITGDEGSIYEVSGLSVAWGKLIGSKPKKSKANILYKGDNIIYGSKYPDRIESGKGLDIVHGGDGKDWFWVSNKYEKGRKNYDITKDFEVGTDWVGIDGSSRGMTLANKDGDAWIMKGKHPIAILENAGGSVDWKQEDGTWWVG